MERHKPPLMAEEGQAGNRFFIKSSPTNKMGESFLTTVSAPDCTKERVFPDKKWLSYFEVYHSSDVVVAKERELLHVPI